MSRVRSRRMRPGLNLAAALGGVLLAGTAAAQDPSPDAWRLSGASELTLEHYDIDGDASASPYRFDGSFWTQRLRLRLSHDNRDGRRFVLDFEGRAARNDYLQDPHGAVLEKLRLELEDAGAGLPYRIGAGDIFTDLSQRTLQRQLKGASFEIQPASESLDQSLLLVAGSGVPDWSGAVQEAPGDLGFAGISYLLAAASGRHSLVANFVDVRQRASALGGAPIDARDHRIGSLFAETSLGSLRFEGEAAVLALDAPSGADDRETSTYAQLSQARGSFSWRARFEDNGADYATPGAVGILADRRIGELHLRWAPRGVGELRARAQAIRSQLHGTLPQVDTAAYGFSYAGVLTRSRPSLRLRLEADLDDIEGEDGLRDERFQSYRLALGDRLGESSEWSYEAKLRDLDDRLNPGSDRRTLEHALRVARRWTLGAGEQPARLRVGLGAVYRSQRESAAFESWSPLLDLTLQTRHHRVGLHLSLLEQDFATLTVSDLSYVTQRASWAWERGRHFLSLDLGQERRMPELGRDTTSLRASVSYRLAFDRSW